MECAECKANVAFCACADIDARLRKLHESDLIVMPWCRACDKHADRCTCPKKIN